MECGNSKESFQNKIYLIQQIASLHCEFCDVMLEGKKSLERHIESHHKWKCENCNQTFALKMLLNQHNANEGKSMCNPMCSMEETFFIQPITTTFRYKCTVCYRNFPSKYLVEVHARNFHKFKCEYCSDVFERKELLDQHLSKLHYFKCEICDRIFKERVLFEKHNKYYHRWKCEICNRVFGIKKFWFEHMSNEHSEIFDKRKKLPRGPKYELIVENNDKPEVKPIDYKCAECNIVFNSKYLFEKHEIKHSYYKYDFIACQVCNKIFRNDNLLVHYKTDHPRITPSIQYRCDECGVVFESKDNIENHSKMHFGKDINDKLLRNQDCFIDSFEVGKYECDECNGAFENVHEFEQHKKIHIVKVTKCADCNEVFKSVGEFKNHSKIHMKPHIDFPMDVNLDFKLEDPKNLEFLEVFECIICQRQFETHDELESHSKCHATMDHNDCPKRKLFKIN